MEVSALMEYQRVLVDGFNRGDVSVIDMAYAPDCVLHFTGFAEPIRGVRAVKDLMAGFFNAFPDLHIIIQDQIVHGDRVASHFRGTGTHKGPLAGAPATGRRIAIDGVIFDRVVDGKIQERWEQVDLSLMLQQLGLA